jgi:hypothetical protein
MNHFKIIVFSVFALALGAGLVAGKLDWTGSSTANAPPSASPLVTELGLTPGQCEQIRGIWEPLRQSARASQEEAKRLDQRRDLALQALLTPEQQEQYGKIKHKYDDRVLALQAKRNMDFRDAVDRTKQLLTDSQRQKYEQLIKDRLNAREMPERSPVSGVAEAGAGVVQSKMVP